MAKVTPITGHFKHFVGDLKESFWGDLQGQVQQSMRKLFELHGAATRPVHGEPAPQPAKAAAGLWQRLLRAGFRNPLWDPALAHRAQPQTRLSARGAEEVSAPAEEVSLLIREAFLRGISTRQVGRVVGILAGEVVSPQTVSRLSRDLDEAVRQFHQAQLEGEWAYLFLDGVSLWVRRPCGRQRVQMLVAYGVRGDGTRQLLGFVRSKGESQSAWEGLLQDLYRRGLKGEKLLLIVTDGGAGLAAAIETVYARALHQRCWVHKMRNILQKVRRRDYDQVKARRKQFMAPTAVARPKPPFAPSATAGSRRMGRWCGNWSAPCQSCCRSSAFPGIYGESCAPATSSNAVSLRCGGAPGPWCALRT
jgi:Transposase, Mutator family